jgi:hypothetical protein
MADDDDDSEGSDGDNSAGDGENARSATAVVDTEAQEARGYSDAELQELVARNLARGKARFFGLCFHGQRDASFLLPRRLHALLPGRHGEKQIEKMRKQKLITHTEEDLMELLFRNREMSYPDVDGVFLMSQTALFARGLLCPVK